MVLDFGAFCSLVPREVATAEIFGVGAAELLPEEELALGAVSDRRRRDFALGRTCARRALATLGCEPLPILAGRSREPLWPEGYCGSITHCDGYCAAAAAPRTIISSIGIDAERRQGPTDDILDLVALDVEREWMQDADPDLPWDILLFSAKESVFKAWFPLVGTWLDFKQARIEFQPVKHAYRAVILAQGLSGLSNAPRSICGRFLVTAGLVQTSAIIPAEKRQPEPGPE